MPDPLVTLVATDIRTGALLLDILNTSVQVTRYYVLLDSNGDQLALIDDQESGHSIPIVDLPPNIRAALHLIDTWTENLVRDSFT